MCWHGQRLIYSSNTWFLLWSLFPVWSLLAWFQLTERKRRKWSSSLSKQQFFDNQYSKWCDVLFWLLFPLKPYTYTHILRITILSVEGRKTESDGLSENFRQRAIITQNWGKKKKPFEFRIFPPFISKNSRRNSSSSSRRILIIPNKSEWSTL